MLSSLVANANADPKPYIGLDVQKRHMFFEQGFGNNLFKHRYPQTNFYAGLQFNQFFSFELGYENTIKLESQVNLKEGERDLGATLREEDRYTVIVKNKLKGPHVGFVFFVPMNDQLHLDLIAMLGISRLQLILSEDITAVHGFPNSNIADDHRDFKQRHWVPRVNIGVQASDF